MCWWTRTYLVKRMCSKRSLARRLYQTCLNCLDGQYLAKTELVEVEEVVAGNHEKQRSLEGEKESERD